MLFRKCFATSFILSLLTVWLLASCTRPNRRFLQGSPADGGVPVDAAAETDPAADASTPRSDAATVADTGTPVDAQVEPALEVYWAFDEASGTTAFDGSGNNFHGTYIGNDGIPEASAMVAPWRLAGPLSRAFMLENAHAVRA